ncbi:LOW QUALITY PROTEIN: NHS-like protein 1 [Cottoperca gobio]|uniref:LOW QUALITY PROTEIN: NHS-like protein 1 n=1 Tax=Cottoperca gobio TaxID=56716 RepID=A0A6J2SAQ1_COTGO|nr:LOW QUALITY PROTEIN: NHS-like protein 1 [Cottoperca gobio]
MPFHQRSVEPRLVSRLSAWDGWIPREETGRGKLRKPVLFSSLDEVGCHTLTNIIYQLSDLSRHASDIFLGIEMEAGMVFRRSCRIQGRLQRLQGEIRKFDPKKIKIPVSNLDEESKWTVHYTAPWHQQENVFLPGSRPPCVEDLHRQAKVNLKTALRECDKLRKDGFRSSQYYSQGPTFSDPLQSTSSLQDEEEDDNDKKSTASSAEDDKSQLSMRPQTPQGGVEGGEVYEVDGRIIWNKGAPLPTPEEKMRLAARAVPTDIVAINVTGAVFDRQASIRRSLINTDTVSRRPKKVKRRKTISGLPDNFNHELAAKGHGGELRPHSMFIPGQYSTLGRVGSVNSTLRRSDTRDSGCQTEEVKVVPPSMRRIRAQRGQGIAAQMAGISTSSSTGSISISSSDSSGILMLPQFNRDPSRFHSLPRQGARVSLSADPIYSSTPIKSEEQTTLQRQIGKLKVDDTVVHMRNAPRTGTLPRPKSQEVRGTKASDWGGGPACVVSPHAAYSTSFIPNATLSSSSEVITLNTSNQLPHFPGSAYFTARSLSLASSTNTDLMTSSPTSFTHSSTCPALATSTPTHTSKDGGLVVAATASESGHSDSSMHSHSTLAATPPSGLPEEQWIYDTPENVVVPHRTMTSSCSTPINQLYSSLEHSSRTTTDSSSLYSQDNDGYYTSMHLDSGLRSRSHSSGHGVAPARTTRHSMYECREMANQEDSGSLYSDRSLSRSISFRKAKKPPLPPARTDSLRRKTSAKKPLGGVSAISGANEPNGAMLNETLIASLQQSLQMGLRGGKGKGASPSSPSHSPSSDYDDPWVLRPRSQSSTSACSSAASLVANANCGGGSNVYSLCHVTPAHSDTSSLRSDYADSWGYYMDYPRNHGDQRSQSPPAHAPNNMSAGAHPRELLNGGEILNSNQAPGAPGQEGGVAVKPKMSTSSPDRVHRLTSPSSGYSSQSNTPTAGTPVPSFVRSMSPSGSRPKPRVPERKSSLLSSVSMSSSSTSLSSNTSDSLKSSGPPPPPPPPLPFPSSTPTTPLSPPPSFPPPLPPCSSAGTPPAPLLPTTPQGQTLSPPSACSTSPEFPPPPSPEMLIPSSSSFNGSFSPPPPPPPPVPSMGPPPPPPLPAFIPPSSSPSFVKAVKDAPKSALSNSPTKSPNPLITPFALQSVQLRSVKRPEKEINGKSDHTKAQETGVDLLQGLKPLEKSHFLDHPTVIHLSNCSPEEDSRNSSPSPVSKLLEDLSLELSITDDTPDSAVINGKPEDQRCFLLNNKDKVERRESLPSPPQSSQSSPVRQKPPVVSKKPKISLLQHFSPHPINKQLPSQHEDTPSLPQTEDQVDAPQRQIKRERKSEQQEEEETLESFELLAESYETSIASQDESYMSASASQSSLDHGLYTNGEAHEEEDEEGDGTSSTTGSISSKEEDTGEVFYSSTAESSPARSANRASEENMVTPTATRPRTTEDLFAAIHRGGMQRVGASFLERSKRKVLGRKESEEDKSRTGGQPDSPPATPTAGSPGIVSPGMVYPGMMSPGTVSPGMMSPGTVSPGMVSPGTVSPGPTSSLPRQTGSIQRNLRKSATSSDTFKALLLKKGSRSETSFRMSATEMLRSTDPRSQRTYSESALDSPAASPSSLSSPNSPCTSPGRGNRAMHEWSRYEALALSSPTSSSFSLSGLKYGRSRTPPSAASSKYNARNRILSSPMTVICEREGELAESEYGDTAESLSRGPTAQTLPVLNNSNGTLSEESRS